MIGATLLNAVAGTLIPLAGGSLLVKVSMLIAAHFLLALGIRYTGNN